MNNPTIEDQLYEADIRHNFMLLELNAAAVKVEAQRQTIAILRRELETLRQAVRDQLEG